MLVVVAHPDDEVLGCGGLLARLQSVRVIHVTDGAPRDTATARHHGFADARAYAACRAAEAEEGLALAGHSSACLTRLGIADQEAPLHLAAIARGLAEAIAQADVVLTHAYEGGHGDHDAVAFAVAAAIRRATARPSLVEMPFYRAALDTDPEYAPHAGVALPWVRQRFVPQRGAGPERLLRLNAAEQDRKRRMLAAHATQAETLRHFAIDTERYRTAPPHDFRAPPHAGELLYERHGWTLTAPLWLEWVAAAEVDLGRGPP